MINKWKFELKLEAAAENFFLLRVADLLWEIIA